MEKSKQVVIKIHDEGQFEISCDKDVALVIQYPEEAKVSLLDDGKNDKGKRCEDGGRLADWFN